MSTQNGPNYSRLADNHSTHDWIGAFLLSSSFVRVYQDHIKAAMFEGVRLRGCSNNEVLENTIMDAAGSGARLIRANFDVIDENEIKNNLDSGIFLEDTSTGNAVRENELSGNAPVDINDISTGTNTFDDNECMTYNRKRQMAPAMSAGA